MVGPKETPLEPGKFRQFLAAFVVNLGALSYGTMVGWQSPMGPQLQSANPPVGTEPMTDEAASWLTAIVCLSGTFMTLAIGAITEKYGRKMTGCLIAVPLCMTWLLTIFAADQTYLFVARFFSGMAGGSAVFLVPLYVSEIASDKIRGMLGSLLVLTLNTGILLAYVFGAVLSFHVFAITAMILPVTYLVLLIFMPESPVYLIRRNRLDDAARSLMWLRAGHKVTVEREISRLQTEVKETGTTGTSVGLTDLFRDKATVKGLIITLGLFCGQQLCGIFAMITYAVTIFEISGSSLSPNASAITIGAIQVFGSYLSTSLMERMGRRPLLLISCLGMSLSHYTLGTFCYLQLLGLDVSSFTWVPVVALSGYMITYCFGMGPCPYVVMSEVFSRDIASLATTTTLFLVWGVAFIVVKVFPLLIAMLGMHGCFFLLGTFCVCSLVFTFMFVPETKGRPRQQIVDELNGVSYILNEKEYVSAKDLTGKTLPPPAQV